MQSVPGARPVVIVALLVALFAMMVHYEATGDDHDPYPTDHELATNYDRYVGDPFYAWTHVFDVESDGIVVGTNGVRLRVDTDRTEGVDRGDVLQVYGTLRPDHRIAPDRMIRSDRRNRQYMFVVSVVGALVTLGGFVRWWRVDFRTMTINRRRSGVDD